MRRITTQDTNDGSRRLFAYCCRCVEYNLNDDDSISAIRKIEQERPFAKSWSDSEITERLRQAELKAIRGSETLSMNLSESRTDVGNAKRLIALHGDEMRWCGPWGQWLVWNGKCWEQDQQCRVEGFTRDVTRKLWESCTDAICA